MLLTILPIRGGLPLRCISKPTPCPGPGWSAEEEVSPGRFQCEPLALDVTDSELSWILVHRCRILYNDVQEHLPNICRTPSAALI